MALAALDATEPRNKFAILSYSGGDVSVCVCVSVFARLWKSYPDNICAPLHFAQALWDVECALGHWLTDEYVRLSGSNSNLVFPAMVMKLSHHGAKASTPINLLNVLYPFVFLSSCAPMTSRNDYGHPSKISTRYCTWQACIRLTISRR
jgi:hypothetical protein